MLVQHQSDDTLTTSAPRAKRPVVWAAAAWAIGTALGRGLDSISTGGWIAAAALFLVAAFLLMRRFHTAAIAAGLAAILAAAAGWFNLQSLPTAAIDSLPAGSNQLAQLEGVVEGQPYHRLQAKGLMGRFDYRAPTTSFVLRVDHSLDETGAAHPWATSVLVHVPAYDDRLRQGRRVRCGGWLSALPPPANPGEKDFARLMAERGITARLSAKSRGHILIFDDPIDPWIAARTAMIDRARAALSSGLPAERDPAKAAMLQSLLLGEQRGELGDLLPAFTATGLTHLLAISGLNLAILAGGAWWVAIAATGRPRWAGAVMLAVVGLYVLMIPPQVPILRSAIMMGVAGLGWSLRRRPIATADAMALAGLGLMIWRPADLFTAGFQLSFGVVAGLLAFTGPILERWAPAHRREDPPLGARLKRWSVEALAVSGVAWLVSMPLVAFHFQAVSLAAIPVGLVMVPVGAALLWAGYAKIILGVIWPWAGAALGPIVWMIASVTAGLVRGGAKMPWALIDLPAPSALWAGATLAAIVLLLGNWRRLGLGKLAFGSALAAILSIGWLLAPVQAERWRLRDAALSVNMFAVGDGSCYLLRSGGEAMMFDCGSNNHLDITTAAIAPALRTLGVLRIPTLVITHPDTDHFSGALELIDRFAVRRLLITGEFQRNAAEKPASAAAFLLANARRRGAEIQAIAAGWKMRLGDAAVEAIWPPADRRFERDNDGSIVLCIQAASRRLLMTGDIQTAAMASMLQNKFDLRSDILELPHHGSHPRGAEDFVAAVNPKIVLQSTGVGRMRNDPWASALAAVQRHVTARDGMVELIIDRQGAVTSRRHARLSTDAPEEIDDDTGVQ